MRWRQVSVFLKAAGVHLFEREGEEIAVCPEAVEGPGEVRLCGVTPTNLHHSSSLRTSPARASGHDLPARMPCVSPHSVRIRGRRTTRACRAARPPRTRAPSAAGSARAQRLEHAPQRRYRAVVAELHARAGDLEHLRTASLQPTDRVRGDELDLRVRGGGGGAFCLLRRGAAVVHRRARFTFQALSERPPMACARAHSPALRPASLAARRHRRASVSSSIFRALATGNFRVAPEPARRNHRNHPASLMGHSTRDTFVRSSSVIE